MAVYDGDGMGGAPWQTDGAAAGAGYGSGLTYQGSQPGFWRTRMGIQISRGYSQLRDSGRTREAEQVRTALEVNNQPRIARNLAVRYANNGERAW